ncbi:MAG: hypothetical protein H8D69_00065 [Chloroflexi bacterium]|nr:hypothetical protein [Chloroflexota bacterium]
MLIAIAAIGFASCSTEESSTDAVEAEQPRQPTPTPVITQTEGVTQVVIHLSPTEGQGQLGTATFVSGGQNTSVEISVEPSTSEAQPIHIHSGVCTDVGAVIHALQNVVKGHSLTVIDLPIEQVFSGNVLVNVHESYANASNYTACGQLPEELP